MLEEYGFISKKREQAKVDMGPLLDMVFILLIFFVVTAQFSEETGVDVERPGAQNASSQATQPIMIAVTPSGSIHVHGQEVSKQTLLSILTIETEKKPSLTALIVGDKSALLGKTVEVMDICSRAGIKKVSIAAQKR